MLVENKIYPDFKSYSHYKKNAEDLSNNNSPAKSRNYKAIVGSAAGVACALALCSRFPKKETTLDEVARMLAVAGAANVGGVLAGSVGATRESKERKWREAAFQMMNTTIPMLMVSSALEICKRVKQLNNTPMKIIGSIIGMVGGAMTATNINNAFKDDDEPKRKYTIKDSIANFDDIIMTISLGFKKILDYVPVNKILPFIYAYCGARAGQKE